MYFFTHGSAGALRPLSKLSSQDRELWCLVWMYQPNLELIEWIPEYLSKESAIRYLFNISFNKRSIPLLNKAFAWERVVRGIFGVSSKTDVSGLRFKLLFGLESNVKPITREVEVSPIHNKIIISIARVESISN